MIQNNINYLMSLWIIHFGVIFRRHIESEIVHTNNTKPYGSSNSLNNVYIRMIDNY